ncbi:MAG: response regulator [Phycisphaeraceae bacterium]
MKPVPLTILLIEDDEESHLITRHLLSRMKGWAVHLDWERTYEAGLEAVCRQEHDLYLIDYRLRADSGLDLLREAVTRGCRRPMIVLTGMQDREVDVEAMRAGAADYLIKDHLHASGLERSVRYALERYRLQDALEEQARSVRELARQLSRAEQQERSRVARLLHDHFQQILASTKMHVESLAPENLAEQRATVQELLDEMFDVSRTLAVELSPPILLDAGLAAALGWLGRWMKQKHAFDVETKIDAAAEPEAECVRLMLFHGVRELLFNVAKHAQVNEAKLTMARRGDDVVVTVADQGVGFEPATALSQRDGRSSFGLAHLGERIKLVGGSMELSASPGAGCRVALIAPRRPFEEPAMPPGAGMLLAGGEVEQPLRRGSPESSQRIRVLLADDHPGVRERLAGRLREQADIDLVGMAADGEQAVELALQLRPTVILMNVVLPRLTGIDAIRHIMAQVPETRVIAMPMHSDVELEALLRAAGAAAYVSKDESVETLLSRIHEVAAPAPFMGEGG